MKPISLTLRAFGPYPGTETIDFEALTRHDRLFLINGKTGSGKSTILDGMTYALYGTPKAKALGPERSGADFVTTLNNGVAETMDERTGVVFVFEVAGTRYRITRSPAQIVRRRGSGDGDFTPKEKKKAEVRLEQLGPDGSVDELGVKQGAVVSTINNLLGLDVAQFRQTVVLPQGQFRDVVTDLETRNRVLRSIFASEKYQHLEEALRKKKNSLGSERDKEISVRTRVLDEAGAERPEQLTARVEELQQDYESAKNAKSEADDVRMEAIKTLSRAERLLEQIHDLEKAKAKLSELEGRAPAMEELRAKLDTWKAAQSVEPFFVGALEAESEKDRAAKQAREDSGKAATAQEALRKAKEVAQQLQQRAPEVESKRAEYHRLEALRPQVAEAAQKEAHQAELRIQLKAHEADEEKITSALRLLDDQKARLESELDALATSDIGNAYDRLHVAREQRISLERLEELENDRARHQAPVAPKSEDGIDVTFAPGSLEAYLESIAPRIVASLQGGANEHDAIAPTAAAEPLRRAHELGVSDARHEEATRRLDDEVNRIVSRWGWTEERPTQTQLDEQILQATDEIDRYLASAKRREELDEELKGIAQERAGQEANQRELETKRETLRGELTASEGIVREVRAQLPDDISDFAALDARSNRLDEEIKGYEAERENAESTLQNLRMDSARLDERAKASEADTQRTMQDHAKAVETYHTKRTEAGFADDAAFESARRPREEVDGDKVKLQEYDEERSEVRSRIKALEGSLQTTVKPDVDALREKVENLEASYQAADKHVEDRYTELKRYSDLKSQLQRADGAIEDLGQKAGVATYLADLASGSLNGRSNLSFESFVLRRQFLDVLAAGNEHFQRMTGNRYAFHLVRDATKKNALELEVVDHHAGQERRPVKTLSGGEGFLAALSLALGLSESTQRAKVPIEALFIDEGFGSLDADTLAQVTRTLRSLPNVAGRSVGIISHVEDLKRLIPNQLLIVPSTQGSRIKTVSNGDALGSA